EDDDQRADDHSQERGRPVTDVEPRRLEPTDAAPVGKADPAGEQGLRAATRAETEKGSLGEAGLPFGAVRRLGPPRGLAACRAPRKRRRTGAARRRRRSASTRRPPRSRSAAAE